MNVVVIRGERTTGIHPSEDRDLSQIVCQGVTQACSIRHPQLHSCLRQHLCCCIGNIHRRFCDSPLPPLTRISGRESRPPSRPTKSRGGGRLSVRTGEWEAVSSCLWVLAISATDESSHVNYSKALPGVSTHALRRC